MLCHTGHLIVATRVHLLQYNLEVGAATSNIAVFDIIVHVMQVTRSTKI